MRAPSRRDRKRQVVRDGRCAGTKFLLFRAAVVLVVAPDTVQPVSFAEEFARDQTGAERVTRQSKRRCRGLSLSLPPVNPAACRQAIPFHHTGSLGQLQTDDDFGVFE